MKCFAPDPKIAEDLDSIAKALGLIVLQWGQAEQSLDLLVAMLWQSFDGKSNRKKIPIMLEPKLKFLRNYIGADPLLREEVATLDELLSRFEKLSSLRNELIHGAAASISPVDNAFIFAKLDVKDGFHHHREIRIEAAEYPRIIARLVNLGRDANALNHRVFNILKQHKPRVL
jgi:hypothetical protein